ncbi:Hemerythrin HHE cation binding domain-containing protein [Nonomuraea solani]|uniref:Hemerythrin HHE cation binding domain-containing protein n=1 Tax=Nonomuraea solani TaxID=1144553 RepID=A0A1H5YAP8_9ACTN|nr:hemerythrin domain-containing protein [Nonomuraea solani]SEG21058.1 Hemerythrin HHE cation binding domain-containing protein [Nonomuraea solani]
MSFSLDMTMMYVMHDALRRELERIARIIDRAGDDPRQILRTAAGWEMFKKYLRAHHAAEDETLWPVMAELLTGREADLALLDAMEAEHAVIDPILAAIDTTLADREARPERLGSLVDYLRSALTAHLEHEENQSLALIDDVLSQEQWSRVGQRQHELQGAEEVRRYLPWMLDDLAPERSAAILAALPEPIRQAYAAEWRPAYIELGLWTPTRHDHAA